MKTIYFLFLLLSFIGVSRAMNVPPAVLFNESADCRLCFERLGNDKAILSCCKQVPLHEKCLRAWRDAEFPCPHCGKVQHSFFVFLKKLCQPRDNPFLRFLKMLCQPHDIDGDPDILIATLGNTDIASTARDSN